MQSEGAEDFGKGYHTVSTDPYFYDLDYKPVKIDYALPTGMYMLASETNKTKNHSSKNQLMKWAYTSECKSLTDDGAYNCQN